MNDQPLNECTPATAGTATEAKHKRRPQTTHSNTRLQRNFPRELTEAMRGRLPEYLTTLGFELRKQGARLVGHCPMHADTSPSFAVFGTDHETCGCYPCGFTGDIFATALWLGKADTFPAAVRHAAAVLGVILPDGSESPPRWITSPAKPVLRRKPEPPKLTAAENERIHHARLRFSNAFHAGEPIVSEIATSLGVSLETLRWAAHGNCGLGLDRGFHGKPLWLCYCYPKALKWRNPDPAARQRFLWLCGTATEPWRMEWARLPKVQTVYLCESESDALALIESGIEADSTSAVVASPGTSSFQAGWAPLFSGKRVVICYDLDAAGIAATAKVGALLKGHAAEIRQWKGVKP